MGERAETSAVERRGFGVEVMVMALMERVW